MFTPKRSSDESSLIATKPSELKVKLPKLITFPALSPNSTLPAVTSAKPETARSPPIPSVTAPVDIATRSELETEPVKAISPISFVTSIVSDAASTPVVRSPPPDWSKSTDPSPATSMVALTAVPDRFPICISPDVVSAEILLATNSRAVVLPIPLSAFRSTVLAVNNPAPLIAPSLLVI